MNRISTYYPVASMELHAVLHIVANVKEKELAKKSAAVNYQNQNYKIII